jgi:hypothetical protein
LQFHKEVILEFATKLCTFLSLGPLAPEAVTSSKVSHKNSTHEEPHHAKAHTMQTKNKTPCSAMPKKTPKQPIYTPCKQKQNIVRRAPCKKKQLPSPSYAEKNKRSLWGRTRDLNAEHR